MITGDAGGASSGGNDETQLVNFHLGILDADEGRGVEIVGEGFDDDGCVHGCDGEVVAGINGLARIAHGVGAIDTIADGVVGLLWIGGAIECAPECPAAGIASAASHDALAGVSHAPDVADLVHHDVEAVGLSIDADADGTGAIEGAYEGHSGDGATGIIPHPLVADPVGAVPLVGAARAVVAEPGAERSERAGVGCDGAAGAITAWPEIGGIGEQDELGEVKADAELVFINGTDEGEPGEHFG